MAQLRREQPQYDAAGVRIVLIGMGTPEEARRFRERQRLPFLVLCDPRRAAYRAFGLTRGLTRGRVSPRGLLVGLWRTLRFGGAISRQQDMAQLGGAFLVDRAGIVRFAFRARGVGEHPATAAVLAAAAALRA